MELAGTAAPIACLCLRTRPEDGGDGGHRRGRGGGRRGGGSTASARSRQGCAGGGRRRGPLGEAAVELARPCPRGRSGAGLAAAPARDSSCSLQSTGMHSKKNPAFLLLHLHCSTAAAAVVKLVFNTKVVD
jgi:hypothetical protein